jgi:hypothetical protein
MLSLDHMKLNQSLDRAKVIVRLRKIGLACEKYRDHPKSHLISTETLQGGTANRFRRRILGKESTEAFRRVMCQKGGKEWPRWQRTLLHSRLSRCELLERSEL